MKVTFNFKNTQPDLSPQQNRIGVPILLVSPMVLQDDPDLGEI